jgi:hypothetical protein
MTYEAFARNGLIRTTNLRNFVSPDSIRRDVKNGGLVRLRRGAFVEGHQRAALSPRDRHILRVRATVAEAQGTVVVAGPSAAALWGMPIVGEWPPIVTVLSTASHRGGRSDTGVRRIGTGFRTAKAVLLHGMPATDLARTTIDVALSGSFTEAIGSVDWALWRRNSLRISAGHLLTELEVLQPRTGAAHVRRLIDFATSLSDSFGESEARAVIHTLGFAAPELQVQFKDAAGEMTVDYFWRGGTGAGGSVGIVGEFDGKQKYTRDEFTGGNPGEIVWKEKKREDRLRRFNLGVVRILTEHVRRPAMLERLLVDAGVPRL